MLFYLHPAFVLLSMSNILKHISLVLFMVLIACRSFAASEIPTIRLTASFTSDTLILSNPEIHKGRLFHKLDEEQKKKLVSALFAFPFPFGFMGAHRVMLGCKPWIPVVYVATFGGCFGLLPLIDFFTIVFTKDLSEYENNPRVFMWLK